MNSRSREWRKANPERAINKIREWRKKNPDKELEYHIRNAYGFSEFIIKKILKWKHGKCCICSKKLHKFGQGFDDACIEHNHRNGNFRGIVCGRCNRVLGMVKDNISLLRRLIRHLKRG